MILVSVPSVPWDLSGLNSAIAHNSVTTRYRQIHDNKRCRFKHMQDVGAILLVLANGRNWFSRPAVSTTELGLALPC